MIRQATSLDAARLADIHITSWQAAYADLLPAEFLDGMSAERERRTEQWQGWLSTDSSQRSILVAVDGEEVVGFAHTGPSGDKDLNEVGELYAMYLDPSRYRQGWGSQLLEAVSEDLRRSGFTTASLWVMTDNTNARAFYEQAGWAADGKVTEMCLGVDIPAVRYQRAL